MEAEGLLDRAKQIRDEKEDGANTALRVGGLMVDMVKTFANKSMKILGHYDSLEELRLAYPNGPTEDGLYAVGERPYSYYAYYDGDWQDQGKIMAELAPPVPIGGIFITKLADNPAVRYPGTTWEKLGGRFLYGTSGQEESGATGGSASVVLSVENMPSHTHALTAQTDESGSHTHTSGNHRHQVDSHSHTQPSHSHSVKMSDRNDNGNPDYLFGHNGGNYGMDSAASGNGWGRSGAAGGESTGSAAPYTSYTNPTTSENGTHSHGLSGNLAETGGGKEFSILPPYIKVHIWERKS